MIQPGRCSACRKHIWRTVTAQKKMGQTEPGEVFIVWPDPTSVYAMTHVPTTGPDTSHTVGIGYCAACAPEIGAPGPEGHGAIVGYETARARYHAWYEDKYGEWMKAWLRDHIGYDDMQIRETMRQWERDRAAR